MSHTTDNPHTTPLIRTPKISITHAVNKSINYANVIVSSYQFCEYTVIIILLQVTQDQQGVLDPKEILDLQGLKETRELKGKRASKETRGILDQQD